MKLVVRNEELREKMREAINLLCDTVKTTLGPKGSNAIISHSNFSPFITNDGVTIAENIESDDVIINTVLEIAKEASIKTNEIVGDGTTTTLVLLQSIFNNGLKLIDAGINSIIIKKELDNALEIVIDKIKSKSRVPTDKELLNIACVAANDREIGRIVSESYSKVKERSSVIIKENNAEETQINYLKGYILETNLASKYFLKDEKELVLEKTNILLIDNYLDNINDISNILNEIIINNGKLVVIANDYDENVINEVLSLNMDNNINVILLKNPEYGIKQFSILKDLKALSNAKIIGRMEHITMNDIGVVDNIVINHDKITMNYQESCQVHSRIKEIEREMQFTKEQMELEFLKHRLAMFNNGRIEILVGDKTTTARREKKMRFDDALCAIDSALDGVLPGGGIILHSISEEIDIQKKGLQILSSALKLPFKQIMYNAGVDREEILKNIKENDYNIIYNLNTLEYENIKNTQILDSTNVVINSLTSAVSIAGMLLTTTSMVINEHKNNLNKISEYNEL